MAFSSSSSPPGSMSTNKNNANDGDGDENKNTAASSTLMYQRLIGKPSFLSTEEYGICILLVSSFLYSIMGMSVKLASWGEDGLSSIELFLIRSASQGMIVVTAMCWFQEEQAKTTKDDESQQQQRQKQRHDGRVTMMPPPYDDDEDDDNRNGILHRTRQSCPLIHHPFGLDPKVRPFVVARGMVGGLGFTFHYYAYSVLPLGEAATLLSLSPIITVVASSIFMDDEALDATVLFAAVASVMGTIFIANPTMILYFCQRIGIRSQGIDEEDKNEEKQGEHQEETSHPELFWGFTLAILGSFCASAVFLLVRKAGKTGVHTLQLLFPWCFFGLLYSLVASVALEAAMHHKNDYDEDITTNRIIFAIPRTQTVWLYVVMMLVSGISAHFLMNYAGRMAPAGLASILRATNIGWSYLWQLLVIAGGEDDSQQYKTDHPRWSSIVGTMLIGTSIILVTTCRRTRKQPKQSLLPPQQQHQPPIPPLCQRQRQQYSKSSTTTAVGEERTETTPLLFRLSSVGNG